MQRFWSFLVFLCFLIVSVSKGKIHKSKIFSIIFLFNFLKKANQTGTCWAANFKSNHVDQTQFKLICDSLIEKIYVVQVPQTGVLHEEVTYSRITVGAELTPGATYYFSIPGASRMDRNRRYPPDWLVIGIVSKDNKITEKTINLL